MSKIAASTPAWWLNARYFRIESTARKLLKNHTRIPIVVSFSSEGSSYHQKICTRKASTVGYGRALSGHLAWWRTWRVRFQVFSYLRQAYQMRPMMTMSGDAGDPSSIEMIRRMDEVMMMAMMRMRPRKKSVVSIVCSFQISEGSLYLRKNSTTGLAVESRGHLSEVLEADDPDTTLLREEGT